MMGHRIVPAARVQTKDDLDRIASKNTLAEKYRVARIAISNSCIAHLPVYVSGVLNYAGGLKVVLTGLYTHLYLKVLDNNDALVFPATANRTCGKSVAVSDQSWSHPYVMIRCDDTESKNIMNSSSWEDAGRTTMVEHHAERMHISTFEVRQRYSHIVSGIVLCRGSLSGWSHYRNTPLEGVWTPNGHFDLPHMCEVRKRVDDIVAGYLRKVGISVVKGRLILPKKRGTKKET